MPIPSVSRPGPTPEIPEIGPATLYRAAVLLEKAGAFADRQWTQGAKAWDAEDRPGWIAGDPGQYPQPLRYCAIGHIERVCTAEDAASFYQPLPVAWLAQDLHDSVPRWNDEPGRAAAEVRGLFQRVSAHLYRQAVAAAAAAIEPETAAAPPAAAR